jgi:hypothetical protein
MTTEWVVVLERLRCVREDDGSGHSEPYIWPVLLWIDGTTLEDPEKVGVAAPAVDRARVVIKHDMGPGETAPIPGSVGVLSAQVEDGFQAMILVVALWEHDETPIVAVKAGFNAFSSELRAAVAARLVELSSSSEEDRAQVIKEITEQVYKAVTSAILTVMSQWPQLLLLMDDVIGSDIMTLTALPDPSAPIPISLAFGGELGGRLLLYFDASQSGGGDVSNPRVIGQAGWADFKFLFAGADQTIYAVDEAGRLLLYQDASQTGGGDVSNPTAIGQSGWADFKYLFAGANQAIYAVDAAGRLLLYFDASQTGGGEVSSPRVIGQGGWADFRFLFAGANQTLYAVDEAGRLLLYRDASQSGGGEVSSPTVIGQGGWADFKFLLAGPNQTIYAVEELRQVADRYEIEGHLEVR